MGEVSLNCEVGLSAVSQIPQVSRRSEIRKTWSTDSRRTPAEAAEAPRPLGPHT